MCTCVFLLLLCIRALCVCVFPFMRTRALFSCLTACCCYYLRLSILLTTKPTQPTTNSSRVFQSWAFILKKKTVLSQQNICVVCLSATIFKGIIYFLFLFQIFVQLFVVVKFFNFRGVIVMQIFIPLTTNISLFKEDRLRF